MSIPLALLAAAEIEEERAAGERVNLADARLKEAAVGLGQEFALICEQDDGRRWIAPLRRASACVP